MCCALRIFYPNSYEPMPYVSYTTYPNPSYNLKNAFRTSKKLCINSPPSRPNNCELLYGIDKLAINLAKNYMVIYFWDKWFTFLQHFFARILDKQHIFVLRVAICLYFSSKSILARTRSHLVAKISSFVNKLVLKAVYLAMLMKETSIPSFHWGNCLIHMRT